MKVTRLSDLPVLGASERPGRHVAIGTFDGVHLGHREVIGGSDTVLTFEPHPLRVLRPRAVPKLLLPFAIKCDLIAELGVSELVVIDFDEAFSKLTPERFVDEIVVGKLGAGEVSVGENFHFGAKADGTTATLAPHAEFETRVVPLVTVDGVIVSSSEIRSLIAAGEVARAGSLLGAPVQLQGEVVHGDKRGRELGMPTANIAPDESLVVPGNGVYAGWAGGHPAAINVGVRPTFGLGNHLLVEPHLLDFDGDLYGQTLRVGFVERLRGEQRFDSVDALIEQMQLDVQHTRAICAAQA